MSRIGLFESIGRWTSHLCRLGFCDTCFITRCCTQSCPTNDFPAVAGGFTRKNSTVVSAYSPDIGVPVAGKRKICRVFGAEKIGHQAAACVLQNQGVSVIGGGDTLSDGEGVVATFFLI